MARRQGGTLSGFTPLSTPSAPTINSVTTSIGSASVAFTAPTDVGDAAVSSYVVTAVDESSGASTGATGSASPITVTPPAGGTFKIRMQALNAYGPGRLTEYDTGNVIYGGAEMWAWGRNNEAQLGLNDVVNRSSPVQVGGLTNWANISASATSHTAAIKTNGTLWAWGKNSTGALGIGNAISRSSPTQVGALTTWSAVETGGETTFAIKNDGSLWSSGWGNSGRTGLNTTNNTYTITQIGTLTNWAKTASSSTSSLAIKSDGTLWSWGGNGHGQLGLSISVSINRSSPVQIGTLTNWYDIAIGNHALATKTDGTLWSWGRNDNGELGLNDRTAGIYSSLDRSSPVQVGALTDWKFVSGGNDVSFAIKKTGSLWAWGSNSNGQLGLNNLASRSSPVQVGVLTDWSKISARRGPQAASVKTNGTLWAWGRNNYGQLGHNDIIDRSSPVQVGSLTTWHEVSAVTHTLALYGVV